MDEETIRLWNPWWTSGRVEPVLLGIPRAMTRRLLELRKTPHINDLIGIRRCGKTTVLYQVISDLMDDGAGPEEILFLNFEDIQLESASERRLRTRPDGPAREFEASAAVICRLSRLQRLDRIR
jgi:predicted AAA+ superfamily ATPase